MTERDLFRDKIAEAEVPNSSFYDIIRSEAPDLVLMTDGERLLSLQKTIADRPDGDVWVFAYGSLIWNPSFAFIDKRVVTISGWRRAFCLSLPAGRGKPENPGLGLALDEGGYCEGVAFRIPPDSEESDLRRLWSREMVTAAYVPAWVDMIDDTGALLRGVTFTIDRNHDQYVGHLARADVITRLSNAAGFLGTSADYLFETQKGLLAHGICDLDLEALVAEVGTAQGMSQAQLSHPAPE